MWRESVYGRGGRADPGLLAALSFAPTCGRRLVPLWIDGTSSAESLPGDIHRQFRKILYIQWVVGRLRVSRKVSCRTMGLRWVCAGSSPRREAATPAVEGILAESARQTAQSP